MTVLIAPDKFKDSLDVTKVCQAMQEALNESGKLFKTILVPMADGGEGTCAMLTQFSQGKKIKVRVLDPLFREIESELGISGDGSTAFIEMAAASGLQLLTVNERNAMEGTTIGTGQLIAAALDQGVTSIVMGVGGSATNDAGIGMGEALGARFYDAARKRIIPIGKNLIEIRSMDLDHFDPRLRQVSFTAICDVSNPFYGLQGAAHVFGPQKGADPITIKFLDDGLRNFASVVQRQLGLDINFPGAGAGGGLGGGAKVFFNIIFQSGVQFIMQFIGLEKLVEQSDILMTGEGKMDEQTLSGKVVQGISDLARKFNKPLFVIVGKNELNENQVSALGVAKLATLVNEKTSESEAIRNTYTLIKLRMKEEIIPFFLSPTRS